MTHEELLATVSYDPTTGGFTRLVRCGNMPKESVVGSKHSEGYIEGSVCGERWLLHRLAVFYMTGQRPDDSLDIDHKNRVRDANHWDNIRVGTRRFNLQNQQKVGRSSKTGLLGVSLHKRSGLWRARGVVGGREICSYHARIVDAQAAAIQLRTKFYPGFVPDQAIDTPAPSCDNSNIDVSVK